MKDNITEIVILSGKGGTGKTSLTASFAALSDSLVLADCDVDAADLHVVTSVKTNSNEPFIAGHEATINNELCSNCGLCAASCRFDAIRNTHGHYVIHPVHCEGCGLCVRICPQQAISFDPCECGRLMISDTRFGPMVHAHLHAAAENSGKLVTMVRKRAKEIALNNHVPLILVDGPPGIGCPVIASITGCSAVVLVTEPTISGLHDVKRVATLVQRFDVPLFICINKADIDQQNTNKIIDYAETIGCIFIGTIPYDEQIVEAQIHALSAIEYADDSLREHIITIWENLWTTMR